MPARLPSLPAAHPDFLQYLDRNQNTPLRELVKPYKEYESKLRETFAQDKGDPALQDPHVNAVPIFAGQESTLKARAREPATDANDAKYIMPLKSEDRHEDGSPATAQSLSEFRENFSLFSEQSLTDMDWNNVVAAGSSVVTAMLPLPDGQRSSKRALREYYHQKLAPSSDVDLFLVGLDEEGAKKKIAQIEECIRNSVLAETTTIRTKNAITIASQYPTRHIQIVLRLYQSISEVLTGFDIDSSCYAYDGKQVWATPRGISSFCSQINEVDLTRRSPSYETRLAKYAHRGFEVYFPDLDRSRVDPTLFERSFVRTLGLARLLLLEKLPTENDREAYLNQRRVERGRPQLDFWARKANRGQLPGNKKDDDPEDIPDWEFDDAVANYHTFTVPYGPKYHAKKIERLLFTKDMLLNAEWNKNNERHVSLHRHPCFLGDVKSILHDCCGECPLPTNDEEREVAEEEGKIYVSGEITFLKDDPGRQQIGSFNPLNDHDWTDMAYLGNTQILCEAIVDGDIDAVRSWLEQEGNDVNHRDHSGRMPLHFAIICGQLEIVKVLVNAGARITSRVADGFTSLHMAAAVGRADILKVIGEKSEANEELEAEKEVKRRAAQTGEVGDVVMIDADNGAVDDKSQPGNDADTQAGSEDDDLDDYENSGEESDADDVTQGSFVKVKNDEPNKEALLDDPFGPDYFDFNVLSWDSPLSPIHVAILAGNIKCIETLVSVFGADPLLPLKFKDSPFNNTSNTLLPLVLACKTARPDGMAVIEKLMDLGVKPSQSDSDMVSSLHGSVLLQNVEAMKIMMEHDEPAAKAALNFLTLTNHWSNPYIDNPLLSAISEGAEEIAHSLLDAGAKSTIVYEDFVTAYNRCEEQSSHKFPKDEDQLRKKFAALDQPVVQACKQAMLTLVKRFVEAGVDVNTINGEGGKKLANDHSYQAGCTLLDLVRSRLANDETRLENYQDQEARNAPEEFNRRLIVPDDPRKKRFEVGGYQDSVAAQDFELARIVRDQLARKRKEKPEPSHAGMFHPQHNEDDHEQLKLLIPDLRELEKWLLEYGAKPFNELHPDHKHEENRGNGFSYQNTQKTFTDDEGTYKFDHTFQDPGASKSKRMAYMKLFNAVWDGDLQTVKDLTLKPIADSENDPIPPIPITTKDGFGMTTLNIAVGRKHHKLAQIIIDIAKAQYQPEDSGLKRKAPRRRYRIRTSRDDDDEDEDEDLLGDPDAIPIMSEVIDEDVTIDDLRTLNETVGSKVAVDDFIFNQGNMLLFVDKQDSVNDDLGYLNQHEPIENVGRALARAKWGWLILPRYALEVNDLGLFKWLIDAAIEASQVQENGKPKDWSSDLLLQGILHEAIREGKPIFAEYIVRKTGALMPLDILMNKVELPENEREKPRYYQGLKLYGKHKADWAKQASGDKSHDFAPKSVRYSPLLKEIANPAGGYTCLGNVEFWLGDTALRLYNQFGSDHSDDKRVAALAKQAGSWEHVTTDWFELRRHLALHLAVLNSDDEEDIAVFKYLLNVMPDTIDKKNMGGYSPLWLAFATQNLEAAKMLVQRGADQTTRDKLGNNILHALLIKYQPMHSPNRLATDKDDAEYDHFEAMLQVIDKRLLDTLFTERSSAKVTGVTPLAVWLIESQNQGHPPDERLFEILTKYMPENVYQMYDGSGQTPVHTLVMNEHPALLKQIITIRPDLLGLENGTGQTPFELAQARFIQKQSSDRLPHISQRQYARNRHYRRLVRTPTKKSGDDSETAYTVLRDLVRGNSQIKRKVISVNDAREVSRRLSERQRKGELQGYNGGSYINYRIRRHTRYGKEEEDENEDEVDVAFRESTISNLSYGQQGRKYGRRAPRKSAAASGA